VAALAEEYQRGCGVQDLASKYNIDRATVLIHLKHSGIRGDTSGRRLNDEKAAEAAAFDQAVGDASR
jgi:hypothetical protein